MSDDDDDDYDDCCFEDDYDEPIDACDECQCNVYEEEAWYHDGFVFCDQCWWYMTGGTGEMK